MKNQVVNYIKTAYGVDAEYFVALQLLNNNDEKAAITKLYFLKPCKINSLRV